ncbi:MAG: hypothetical protein FWD82_08120 [Defluviitaleaceae bacterium]|nr:hypothetical protein [Defluviitaleaceae bacterium]
MDELNIYWDLFQNSGRIDAYLAYKKFNKVESSNHGNRKSSRDSDKRI